MKDAASRTLLVVLASGNMRRRDRFEVYIDELGLSGLTKEELDLVLSDGIVAALCSRSPTTYPRHRWGGASESVDDVAITQAFGGLLSDAYELFCTTMGNGVAARAESADADVMLGPPFAVRSASDNAGSAASASRSSIDEAALNTLEKSPEVNERRRCVGLAYLRSNPFGRMVRLRIVLEPLQRMLTRRFHIDSFEWEMEQRALLINAQAAGRPLRGARRYKATMAAFSLVESEAQDLIQAAYSKELLWSVLPDSDFNNQFRCESFIALSKSGASIEELHVAENQTIRIAKFVLYSGSQSFGLKCDAFHAA